jgi:hypothetical protein
LAASLLADGFMRLMRFSLRTQHSAIASLSVVGISFIELLKVSSRKIASVGFPVKIADGVAFSILPDGGLS